MKNNKNSIISFYLALSKYLVAKLNRVETRYDELLLDIYFHRI